MENFLKTITKDAGSAILKKFGKVGVKYTKKDATDVVTEADLISNNILTKAIKKKYPTHGIISEETGESQLDSDYVWIIDPLDGTRNFSTRTPIFAVMVCLVHKGELEMSAIYNPYTKEFFFAKKGKGTFRNGKKVFCSDHTTWKDSWGIFSARMSGSLFPIYEKILNQSKKEPCWVSAFGSSGDCTLYLADGRRDWRISQGGGVWDYAAAVLILEESGCVVTNLKGQKWSLTDRELVAANKYLHPVIIKILNK